LLKPWRVFGADELAEVALEERSFLATQELFGGAVGGEDAAMAIESKEANGGGGDQLQ
jgi:hypothetical protein